MLSLTTRSNGGKAELLFDSDADGIGFTVLVGEDQYDFEISSAEWEKLKTFIDEDKRSEQ